jgi:3,4-dihydroxy 2-butanone 4-phosphate synthase / GTP cyclohydrolase II
MDRLEGLEPVRQRATVTGSPPVGLSPVETAIEAIACGEMVVVVDAGVPADEGGLVIAAEHVTADAIAFMARIGGGLPCAVVPEERLRQLKVPSMPVNANIGPRFHMSVAYALDNAPSDAAAEIAATVRTLVAPGRTASDFRRPGHIVTVAGTSGGVLARPGQPEAAVDLTVLAGITPGALVCPIVRPNGQLARLAELLEFSVHHGVPVVSITDLMAYRRRHERSIVRVAGTDLRLPMGTFAAVAYRDEADRLEHIVLTMGSLARGEAPLVRVHSECLLCDAFGAERCDCGRQLGLALQEIVAAGRGAVIYLRGHEGRGAGLDAIADADRSAGPRADMRDYRVAAEILAELGVSRVRLLTNSSAKHLGLEAYGVTVVERIALEVRPRRTDPVDAGRSAA